MNLVLCGSNDTRLKRTISDIVRPLSSTRLNEHTLRFEGVCDTKSIRNRVRNACANAHADHAFVSKTKIFCNAKILAIDMDSTLITIECIDEIAAYAGKRFAVSAITDAAMQGDIPDFSESLKRRVAYLKGIHVNVLQKVLSDRLTLTPGAIELARAARVAGIYSIILSGGFSYYADRVRDYLEFNASYSNVLEIKDDRLTGKLIGSIVGPQEKAMHLVKLMESIGCLRGEAIAIGDGANDILMMKCVVHSVAYHAKPIVTKYARYSVTYGTLKTVLDILA